jgi:hypothetical protein
MARRWQQPFPAMVLPLTDERIESLEARLERRLFQLREEIAAELRAHAGEMRRTIEALGTAPGTEARLQAIRAQLDLIAARLQRVERRV